jgi:DNA-binding MarR family transcriptional regulator
MADEYYESALLRLRRVTSYLSLGYVDVIKNENLTPVQFEVLLYLQAHPACSVSDVAQFMYVDKSSTSRVLRCIEDKGLIEVQIDQADRRRRTVSLTKQGGFLVEAYKKHWLNVEKDVQAKYDDAIKTLELS